MAQQHPSRPLPPVLVDCPWCGSPVELDHDSVTCGICQVRVDVAPARASGRRLRRAA